MSLVLARDDLSVQIAGVMVEDHVEELRSHPRRLTRRLLGSRKETRRPEWRPAEQPCAEDSERDRHCKLAANTDKGSDAKRGNPATDLDPARDHGRARLAQQLQHKV